MTIHKTIVIRFWVLFSLDVLNKVKIIKVFCKDSLSFRKKYIHLSHEAWVKTMNSY